MSLLPKSSIKKICIFKEPTNRSHPIRTEYFSLSVNSHMGWHKGGTKEYAPYIIRSTFQKSHTKIGLFFRSLLPKSPAKIGLLFNSNPAIQRAYCRVVKTHRMLYLYRSFSAKELHSYWLFCGKRPAKIGLLFNSNPAIQGAYYRVAKTHRMLYLLIGRFLQKSRIIRSTFAERDLLKQASFFKSDLAIQEAKRLQGGED